MITNVSMRSHKSSGKAEKNTRIIDVSRTVRRRLNMNTDVESQDQDEPMVTDIDKDEFFLSKNSKLFSQVSTNTLKTTEMAEPNDCKVVEVKALEIVKSVAGATNGDDRVVLPKANFGVQQVPQVGEIPGHVVG